MVLKDMMLIRKYLLYILAITLIFSVVFDPFIICVLGPVLFGSLLGSTFALDEQCRWYMFAVSTGYDRKGIVNSKYVSAAVLVLIGTVVGLLFATASGLIRGSPDILSLLMMSVLGMLAGLLAAFVSICVNFLVESPAKASSLNTAVTAITIGFFVASSMISFDLLGGASYWILAVMAVFVAVVGFGTHGLTAKRFLLKDL